MEQWGLADAKTGAGGIGEDSGKRGDWLEIAMKGKRHADHAFGYTSPTLLIWNGEGEVRNKC
jgi:hypothetical protein